MPLNKCIHFLLLCAVAAYNNAPLLKHGFLGQESGRLGRVLDQAIYLEYHRTEIKVLVRLGSYMETLGENPVLISLMFLAEFSSWWF